MLQLTTPALLFSTVSLLMLAYTNRFLAIANLIRNLHDRYQNLKDDLVLNQIRTLRRRIALIRDMQVLAVFSLFLSVVCMFLLFYELQEPAKWMFGGSLLLLGGSLFLALVEVRVSVNALNILLSDIEQERFPIIKSLLNHE